MQEKLEIFKNVAKDGIHKATIEWIGEEKEKEGQYGTFKFKTARIKTQDGLFLHFINQNDFGVATKGATINIIKDGNQVKIMAEQNNTTQERPQIKVEPPKDDIQLSIMTQAIFKTIYDKEREINPQVDQAIATAEYMQKKIKESHETKVKADNLPF